MEMNHKTLTNDEVNTYLAEKVMLWEDYKDYMTPGKVNRSNIDLHKMMKYMGWKPTQDERHLEQVIQEVVKDENLMWKFLDTLDSDDETTPIYITVAVDYLKASTEEKARAIVAAHLLLTNS